MSPKYAAVFARTSLYVSRYATNQAGPYQWVIVCTDAKGKPSMIRWSDEERKTERKEIGQIITVGTLSNDNKPKQICKLPLNRDNLPNGDSWDHAFRSACREGGFENPSSGLSSEYFVLLFLKELEHMGHLHIGQSIQYINSVNHYADAYDALPDGERIPQVLHLYLD